MEGELHGYHAKLVEECAVGCAYRLQLHLLVYVDVVEEWHSHVCQIQHAHEYSRVSLLGDLLCSRGFYGEYGVEFVGMVPELGSRYIRKRNVHGHSQNLEEEELGNTRRVRTDLGDKMCFVAQTAS